MPGPSTLLRLLLFLALLLPLAASAGLEELPEGREFGAGLSLAEPVSVATVAADPAAWSGRPILLRGRVADVCQRKGCWTVLAEGDAFVRVRFEDYAFFVPPDIRGRTAFVEGLLSVKTLSEKDARHYARESGRAGGAEPSGPQRELALVARGVRIVD